MIRHLLIGSFLLIHFPSIPLQASSNDIAEEFKGNGNKTNSKLPVPVASNSTVNSEAKDFDKFSKEFSSEIPSDKSKESRPFQKKEFMVTAFEATHAFLDLSSAGLKLSGNSTEAEQFSTYAGLTKIAMGAFRIGDNAIDIYDSQDLGKFGQVLRGASDLLSYTLDQRANTSYSGLISLKKAKEDLEIEVKLNKKVNTEKIQLLSKNIENAHRDIKNLDDALADLKEKEGETVKILQRMLMEKMQCKASNETEIESLKSAVEAEDERMIKMEQQVVSKEREYNMHDKGAFFVKFFGILSAKFLMDEQAYSSVDQLGKTILATAYETFKSEPVKTGKYLKEIGFFLYGIYGSLHSSPQNKNT